MWDRDWLVDVIEAVWTGRSSRWLTTEERAMDGAESLGKATWTSSVINCSAAVPPGCNHGWVGTSHSSTNNKCATPPFNSTLTRRYRLNALDVKRNSDLMTIYRAPVTWLLLHHSQNSNLRLTFLSDLYRASACELRSYMQSIITIYSNSVRPSVRPSVCHTPI